MLCVAPRLSAQLPGHQSPGGWRLWAAFGLGFGGSAKGEGAAVVGELVFQRSPHHLALRATGIADLFDPASCGMGDLGVVYGRTAIGSLGHATVGSGLALTSADRCDGSGGSRGAGLGVPIVAEVALRLAPVVGIGLQAFANVNPRASFGGVVVFLQLGWLPR
jgi:hypothetical protein